MQIICCRKGLNHNQNQRDYFTEVENLNKEKSKMNIIEIES
jgi:hypothetical protein